MIFIYALLCPFTVRIRYVGKTVNPGRRYTKHLHQGSPHMRAWVNVLKRAGYKPVFHILDILPDDAEWEKVERFWIWYYRECGYDLINCDDGGRGGRRPTAETLHRMRLSRIGFRHTDDTKRKLSEIVTGRKHKPETIQKLRERPHTWGDKISASKMGHEVTDTDKAKMSASRIAYYNRVGRKGDVVRDYLEIHPETHHLSCREIGRRLEINHQTVACVKREMGLQV